MKVSDHTLYADGHAGADQSMRAQGVVPANGLRVDFGNSTRNYKTTKARLTKPGVTLYTTGGVSIPVVTFDQPQETALTHEDPFLGRSTTMKALLVKLPLAKDFINLELIYSPESKFYLLRALGSETWRVPESRWNQSILGATDTSGVTGTVQSDPRVYNTGGPFLIQIELSHPVEFPNLSAYWTPVSQDPQGDTLKAMWDGRSPPPLNEPSDPLVTDQARLQSERNLQSTDLIQIDLPKIQEMIQGLKATGKTNRLDMAKEVVKVVDSYLKYDKNALETGFVYPLSTSDILKRHLGVCQHFANLFTALARGVGIPTRMVGGFYISQNSLDLHAWNEIEIRDGVWRPVEPQLSDLSINPSVYLPFLDNVNETSSYGPEALAKMEKFVGLQVTIKILEAIPAVN